MQVHFPLIPRPRGHRKGRDGSGTRRSPEARHGYIRSFDGTKLFYSVEGEGKPLVFCYGLVCSSLHWTYQIDHFRQNYQTIWFDYRGHHNSDVPEDLNSLTIENIARDLGVVLDELGVKDTVILGHSMGVNVALDFYRQQPERVAGLVLANGTAMRPLEAIFSNSAAAAALKLLDKAYRKSPELVSTIWKMQRSNPLTRTLVALGGFNPHLTPKEDIALYVELVADMDPAIFLQLIRTYDAYDATAWLHTVKAPALLIAGEHDHMTPLEKQELMHQLFPRSELEIIRHGSHCPQMDLPDQVNRRIEAFLASINYAAAPSPTTESASRSTDSRREAEGPDPAARA